MFIPSTFCLKSDETNDNLIKSHQNKMSLSNHETIMQYVHNV